MCLVHSIDYNYLGKIATLTADGDGTARGTTVRAYDAAGNPTSAADFKSLLPFQVEFWGKM